jgi:aryl-alcohol dehydrogenase
VIEASGDQNMHQLAIDVLNSCCVAAPLTGETGINFLSRGRKTLGIIQSDAVPQSFIPKLIELYRAK